MNSQEMAELLSDLLLRDKRFQASVIKGNELFVQFNDLEEMGPVSKWVAIQVRLGNRIEEMDKPTGRCGCPHRSRERVGVKELRGEEG
ncbi:hypothetical protein HM1_0508 [Heliomicrobium modesticaldum Ice1]|uniref:Uncharacterized protein n=1 Tax=Heliobacterium modesticaldum (strain ATCC 51547 / Ice1) TaxID=498761 RepID=B0TFM3_HELMI|nr:hypothetical protein [Heliomicrobium modesticaldum]ABZ83122.1 hypothetical protein HM1_0508 [Heliomicrobium modesticaldum Ice1]